MRSGGTCFRAAAFAALVSFFTPLESKVQSEAGDVRAMPTASVPANPFDQLTPDQRAAFDQGAQAFKANHYSEAGTLFRQLLPQLPPGSAVQAIAAKFTAESAIETGDIASALQLLNPLRTSDANDWQAVALLARVYAETGRTQMRDAELAHLTDLHKRAVSPQIAQLQQFQLERIPLSHGFIRVFYALEPWGGYKTYILARVFDESGQQRLRITLESSDFDQKSFAENNPEMAAKGMRRFSIDGYRNNEKLPNGQISQTHMTFALLDGQPSYDTFRERMIGIAEGKATPTTQSTKPVAH